MNDVNERLVEFHVSPEANHFVKEYLQAGVGIDGGHPFTELLLEYHDLLAGTVFTLMPTSVNTDDLLHFRAARMGDIGNITGKGVVQRIQQHLASQETALCVFEDRKGRKGDPCGPFEESVWFIGEIPYYFLQPEHVSDIELIRGFVREIDFYFFFGTMMSLPEGYTLPPQRDELTHDDLRVFAKHTHSIIWSAYDDAGFLFWQPGS